MGCALLKADPESGKRLILGWLRGPPPRHFDSQHPSLAARNYNEASLKQRPTSSQTPIWDPHGSTGMSAKLCKECVEPRTTLEPHSG